MDNQSIIYRYGLGQAIEDGVLVECFGDRGSQLSGGKPIVTSAAVNQDLSRAALMEIWNGYVSWCQSVRPTLPEEDQLYTSVMNGKKVWVIEDAQAFTILYPEDY